MKYSLDTNILIDHIRGKASINNEIVKAGVIISVVVLGELYYGAFKSDHPQKSLVLIEALLQSLNAQIEDLTDEIMYEFGTLKASLEKTGERIDDFDLLIAATAKKANVVLVTNNKKHFERIKGLKLFV